MANTMNIPKQKKGKLICYHCGDEGHYAPACTNYRQTKTVWTDKEPDLPKVQLPIGEPCYVVGQYFKGNLYLHIREYTDTPTRLVPTKKGIALTPQQWKELELFIPLIEAEVRNARNGEKTLETWHLGSNWMVTVNNLYPGVDIRKFWMPPTSNELSATKKGMFLTYERFDRLKNVISEIPHFLPELNMVVPCYLQDDHQNQMGALECRQCHPNGWMNFPSVNF